MQDKDKIIKQLKAENATYKANAVAVQKYITQNEQLKTHIDGLEKKNAELKAYVKDRDEYTGSLLLTLFLMQGEINRLNETLDLARKGELVYINNPQIAELKAENKELAHYLACMTEQRNKANIILQEIKEYAESIGNEEMINGYAIRAKSALWRIANKITKEEEE